MKRLSILFFTLFLSYISFGQIDIDFLNRDDIEAGKCFHIYPLDTLSTAKVYLEIVPTVFETHTLKTANPAFIKEFKIDLSSAETEVVQISPTSKKWVQRKGQNNGTCNPIGLKYGLTMCLVEVPARYISISKKMILENNDTLYYPKEEKITFRRLKKTSFCRVISVDEVQASKNEVIELVGDEWEEWRENLSCGCGRAVATIKEIQQALKDLGYDIEVDGVLGSKEKAALVDFQKKNNLPEGRLDIETLEALGLLPLEKY